MMFNKSKCCEYLFIYYFMIGLFFIEIRVLLEIFSI